MPQLFQYHPEPRLQKPWNSLQFGLLLFPVSPFLGALGVLAATALVWQQRFKAIVRSRLNQGFALLFLFLFLSSTTAVDPESAFLGLFNFLPFMTVFAAGGLLVKTPEQLRRIAWIVAIASVPVAFVGIGQMYSGWTGPIELWMLVDWPLEAGGTPPDRMASVFEHANVLANYSLIVFLLVLGLWIEIEREWKGLTPAQLEMRYARGVRLRRRLLAAVLIGHAIAIVSTSSRNAWAIAILGGLAYGLFLGWRWLLMVLAAGTGLVFGAAFAPSPLKPWLRQIVPRSIWARLTDELYPDRPVALLRITQWEFAGNMTLERPWTGWGLRNFTTLYQDQMQLGLSHPHNFVLMMAAETGIPATLLLLGLVGWVLFQGVQWLRHWTPSEVQKENKVYRDDRLIFFSYLVAFGALALFHLFDVTLFDSRINLLGWLLLAAIWGVVTHQETANR